MKIILKINKVTFYATLALMLTFYGGPLGLIILGFVQVISAIYLTYHLYNKSDEAKKHLTIYWILAITEIVLLFITIKSYYISDNLILSLLFLIAIPFVIAIYFLIISTKLIKENENTK